MAKAWRAGGLLLMAGLAVTLVQPAHSAPLGRASYALEFDGRIGEQWQVRFAQALVTAMLHDVCTSDLRICTREILVFIGTCQL
jgi:hypothetical protein